jgi:lysophospholipase L1-like esterase
MQAGDRTFERQTLRQIVRTSIGGDAARVRLSNRFGAAPVTVSGVRLARRAHGSTTVAGTDRAVTFGGAGSVTIPAGESVASDDVGFTVPSGADVAVSMFLPAATGGTTRHALARVDNYVAPGDQSADPVLHDARTAGSYFLLTGLDVHNAAAPGAVVAFGASITDGFASTTGANRRWPDLLAGRLHDSGRTVGMLNAGLSGNRLLLDGTGESALRRFDRDVLAQPGVRWVIFADDPLNDLGRPDPPSAAALTAALSRLITRAHAAGIRFVCSTLTPFEGAGYWTPLGEESRAAYNAFVRGTSSGCDAVLDQDAATHDPAQPRRLLPADDSGDHLHPDDAGMRAIADAADLAWFS